jgi:hypothetical protein
MSTPTSNDKTAMICSCGELHKGHICYLTNMGLMQEVYHLSNSPAVTCSKCGARANFPHNVCFPDSGQQTDLNPAQNSTRNL